VHTIQDSQASSRSTAKCLRHGPYSLCTVITKDVEPVLEGLDPSRDVVNAALAVVTTATTKVGATFRMPDRRKGCINSDWVCILEHDICTLHVRSEVVILGSG